MGAHCDGKFGECARVGYIIIGHFRKRDFVDGKLPFFNKVKQKVKRTLKGGRLNDIWGGRSFRCGWHRQDNTKKSYVLVGILQVPNIHRYTCVFNLPWYIAPYAVYVYKEVLNRARLRRACWVLVFVTGISISYKNGLPTKGARFVSPCPGCGQGRKRSSS